MGMVGELGGITALLVFAIGGLVSAWTNFNIDNSMVSRLYTLPNTKLQSSKQQR